MSFLAIVTFILFSLYLLTRFGKRIHAKNATSWWLVITFLLVGIVRPEAYATVAHLFGIQLVSNFAFAAMILFLLKTTLENSADSTRTMRKLRELVCNEAARRFCESASATALERKPEVPHVLVILPTYNEQDNIRDLRATYDANISKFQEKFKIQFCFVNDASVDATEATLKQYWGSAHVSHLTNVGVAGVLVTGFKICQALDCDYAVQCDADGQHPLEKIPYLIEQAIATKADLTIGSRFVDALKTYDQLESTTWTRRLGGISIGLILRCLFPVGRISDPTSGFRVYSRQAMRALLNSMPDDYPEPESIAVCAQQRLHVWETPVRMKSRQGGVTSISGLKSLEFMIKVITSLLSLRVRSLLFMSTAR